VILANRGYEILKQELYKGGANPGRGALDMLEMDRPQVDFVALAGGMGVPGERVDCAQLLAERIAAAAAMDGPRLIEACIAQ
jgi:acetolactate synthase-1/2/3 large subunit